ncbi:MAG: hypothetical protein KC416_00290 [Myxococcales bacterium]|nr:hypothetical protein [Myxococcales bacterium]
MSLFPHRSGPVGVLRAVLQVALIASLLGAASEVCAQEGPSLAVPSDAPRPLPAFGLDVDVMGLFFSNYSLRAEVGADPFVAWWLSPAWAVVSGVRVVGLEAGLHWWPGGQGLAGLYVGPSLGMTFRDVTEPYAFVGAVEAGYQVLWGGVTTELSGGLNYVSLLDGKTTDPFGVRVQLSLGYVWT